MHKSQRLSSRLFLRFTRQTMQTELNDASARDMMRLLKMVSMVTVQSRLVRWIGMCCLCDMTGVIRGSRAQIQLGDIRPTGAWSISSTKCVGSDIQYRQCGSLCRDIVICKLIAHNCLRCRNENELAILRDKFIATETITILIL